MWIICRQTRISLGIMFSIQKWAKGLVLWSILTGGQRSHLLLYLLSQFILPQRSMHIYPRYQCSCTIIRKFSCLYFCLPSFLPKCITSQFSVLNSICHLCTPRSVSLQFYSVFIKTRVVTNMYSKKHMLSAQISCTSVTEGRRVPSPS